MNDLFEPLVLHIEDNADDEMLVKRAFRAKLPHANLANARDGREAHAYLFEGKTLPGLSEYVLPDLVLLDLKLPIIGGIELLEKIRSTEATRHLPVVILTSSDEPRDVERSYRAGANSYVSKPVDFEKFTEAVVKIGSYWLETNRIHRSDGSFARLPG